VSPSWDASQTRTAGNYLVCKVTNWGGTTGGTPGTPAGWTQLLTIKGSSRASVTYFGKVAAGSDAAPTVSATNTGTATFSTLSAQLHELAGVDATTPVGASGTATGTTASPFVVTTSGNVPQTGCYALGAASIALSAQGTSTLGAGSGWTNTGDNGTTSTRAHWIYGTQSNPTSGATLSESFSYTNLGAFLAGAVVVFQPPAPTPTPSVVACVASVGSATVTTGETVTPSVVAAVASIGASSPVSKPTPAVVACVASIGSAIVNTGEKVTPSVVAATATIGSPLVNPLALRSCQSVTTGGGSLTLAVPAQPCAIGDLIFIWAVAGFASHTWTSDPADSLSAETANSSSSPAESTQLFSKIADSSDVAKAAASGSYTLTISISHTWNAIIGVVPVTSTTHPFDPSDTPGSGQSNAASNAITAAGITTTTDGLLLVWLGADRIGSGGTPPDITVPAGYTAACSQANGSGSGTVNTGTIAAIQAQVAHGTTGSVAGSFTGTTQITAGLLLGIKAAPIVPLPGTVAQLVAGAPTPSGFGVITKLSGATSVRLAYSTSPSMTSPSFVSAQTPDANGYVTHAVSGLSAATRYYVQAADTPTGGAETLVGPIGSCKTLAASGSPASFTVALAACVAEQDVTSPAQNTAINDLVAWAPDLTIFTGDFDYSGSTATSTDTQRGVYESQIAGIPGLAAMVETTWGYYCRSDHEAGPDNGDSNNAYTAANIAAARQVFPFGTLGDTVNTPVHGLYQSWVVGRVRFIMVDIRNTDRSPGGNTDDGSKTMLGATQLAWLESELVQSEPLKVIISDVAWMGTPTISNGPDKWWSYDTERQAIISYINANRAAVKNLMLWHGDSHLVGYATSAKNTWGGFPVYCAAPLLNTGGGLMQSTFSALYNNTGGEARQYGRITITDTGSVISVNFQGWDATNAVAQVSQTDTFNTTQPSVISCVATIGSPTVGAGSMATPPVVACPASVGSTVVKTGETVTPAVVACVASVPSPAPNTGSKVTPSVVPGVATIGAPTVSATKTALSLNAEGGTNGVTVTAGNSGGASGDAFDSVPIAAGGTFTYSSTQVAEGTLSYHITTDATGEAVYGEYKASIGTQPLWFFTIDLWLSAFPAHNHRVITFVTGASSLAGYIQLTTAGNVQLVNAAAGVMAQLTGTWTAGQWFRVAGFILGDASVGQGELRFYAGKNDGAPAEVHTSAANQNTGGTITAIRPGVGAAVASVDYYWDRLRLTTTAYVDQNASPAVVPAVATIGASSPASIPAPAVVSSVATIGAAAPSTGETAKPGVVASVATVGAAVIQASSTAKPGVVPALATIGAAVVGAASTATPGVVPALATFGTTTPNTGTKVTPGVVPGIATVGNPAPNTGAVANPVVISVSATITTPVVSTITKATPSVVSVTATIGTASPHGGAQASPGVITATATISIPAMHTGSLVQAVVIACAAVLASPTVVAAKPYNPGPWRLGEVHVRWIIGPAHSSGYAAGDASQRWGLGSVHSG
jgi:hypothetical protein